MHPTIHVVLDTRRMKKGGTYPLKLQVTQQRKTRHFPTIFNLSKVDYDKLSAPRISTALQWVRDGIRRLQREADAFLDEMPAFSFFLFQRDFVHHHDLLKRRKLEEGEKLGGVEEDVAFRLYYKRFPILKEKHLPVQSIGTVYQAVIKNLLKEERIGTALA